jgi:hypothetical protein
MAEDSILERIERSARRAIIQNAVFRWESALTISGMILLSVFLPQPFFGWPWWGWLAIGVVGEAGIVLSSLTDVRERQRVVESLFRAEYNSGGLRDKALRDKLAEAEQYRQRIQDVLAQQAPGLFHDRLAETTTQVYDWIANMVRLARRIDAFRTDDIVRRDSRTVPAEIQELSKDLERESDPAVKAQMQATLTSKRQLDGNLRELAARMERADLQLDHSLASLGTVYAQLLLIGSADVDSDRTERLRQDIRDEVGALQDLVTSINEVYQYQPASELVHAAPASRASGSG